MTPLDYNTLAIQLRAIYNGWQTGYKARALIRAAETFEALDADAKKRAVLEVETTLSLQPETLRPGKDR